MSLAAAVQVAAKALNSCTQTWYSWVCVACIGLYIHGSYCANRLVARGELVPGSRVS